MLRPGSTRVHGQRHRLRGHGAGYSISLHARAVPPGPRDALRWRNLSQSPACAQQIIGSQFISRNVEVIG